MNDLLTILVFVSALVAAFVILCGAMLFTIFGIGALGGLILNKEGQKTLGYWMAFGLMFSPIGAILIIGYTLGWFPL